MTTPADPQYDTDKEAHMPPTNYEIDIEGVIHPWAQATITVPQLRTLGDLPQSESVLEVNLQTQVEITLAEDAVVDLKPGHGFSRKVGFKRG